LNPPFTASDLKSLYAKVLKGNYSKIPPSFSPDLSAMIKSLLQVDPKNRPSTKQIIHMPVFIAKYNEIREEKAKDFDHDEIYNFEEDMNLLGTIKVPRNLKLLSERLPKSNYGNKKSESTASSDDSDQS
jgi:NIMA (never in mitosis gene a)-related kinase